MYVVTCQNLTNKIGLLLIQVFCSDNTYELEAYLVTQQMLLQCCRLPTYISDTRVQRCIGQSACLSYDGVEKTGKEDIVKVREQERSELSVVICVA